MKWAEFRLEHRRTTLICPTQQPRGRSFAKIGRTRLSYRVLPMALSALFVFMACQVPIAAPAEPSVRQRLPGLAVPLDDKAQRTPAQKKISSQLWAAIAQRADASRAAPRGSDVDADAAGRVLVDIDATITDELLDAIEMMEGSVVNSFPRYDAVRARVPLDQVESLAERFDVRFIRKADIATTNSPKIVP